MKGEEEKFKSWHERYLKSILEGLQMRRRLEVAAMRTRHWEEWKRERGCSSVTQLRLTLCDPMDCSTPGFPILHHLPKLAQTQVHGVGNDIQPSCPLSFPSPPAFNLSQYQDLFQWVSSSHQVAKYWSFSFSISPSTEYSGLIPFRIDWFDLLAVQGTLESSPTPQFRSINSSVLSLFLRSNSYIHA